MPRSDLHLVALVTAPTPQDPALIADYVRSFHSGRIHVAAPPDGKGLTLCGRRILLGERSGELETGVAFEHSDVCGRCHRDFVKRLIDGADHG